MAHPHHTLSSDLRLLGLSMQQMEECVQGALRGGDHAAATEALRGLIKEARKERMRQAHPDKGGSTEEAQEINAAADRALSVRIQPPPPPPQQVFIQVVHTGGWSGTATSTGTTTTSGIGWW